VPGPLRARIYRPQRLRSDLEHSSLRRPSPCKWDAVRGHVLAQVATLGGDVILRPSGYERIDKRPPRPAEYARVRRAVHPVPLRPPRPPKSGPAGDKFGDRRQDQNSSSHGPCRRPGQRDTIRGGSRRTRLLDGRCRVGGIG
jgi:hypothetical protein